METGMEIKDLVRKQRKFFRQGKTIDLKYRRNALLALYEAIEKNQHSIMEALKADLGKSQMESYMCEIGLTLSELRYTGKHMRGWAGKRRFLTEAGNLPGQSFTVCEPYGVVLIMAPWNYPVLLCLEPLIGAIAAGNCCVVKPSAYAPQVAKEIGRILGEIFPREYVAVVPGGRAENAALLEERFDTIFFTGSVSVGRLVMEKASRYLTPVILELGGKSPCIVGKSANLKLAARRIAFGKYLNCGQTCVAPDYLLIHSSVKDEFLMLFQKAIREMYGQKPLENGDYGRIVNKKHFERLIGLIDKDKVICGGKYKEDALQIEPTVLDGITPEDSVMKEEIFGPILPVLTFDHIKEAEQFVTDREKPLALYLFTSDKKEEERFLKYVSYGGGCINDTIIHLATSRMGFGGVGSSGMGSYHGKKSFQAFSHEKSIVRRGKWPDLPIRYQPYLKIKEKIVRLILK